MSDETNGSSSSRLDRIEQALAETAEMQREMQKAQMQHEFTTAARSAALEKEVEENRRQSEARWQRIEATLDHLTQLVGIFGDKTFEFEEKAQRVKDAL